MAETASTRRDPMDLDFAWLANAAPLMSAAYWAEHGASAVDWRPAVPPSSSRSDPEIRQVGRRFEWLHREALAATSGVELLACNHQLRDADRTLGELDVLYQRDGVVIHREVAVKYYLAVGGGTDAASWIGSSRRDRLSLKLARLQSQQLALPRIAADAGAWPSELPFPERSEVLLLGALFAPEGDARLPEGANPNVERGMWWEASDFARRYEDAGWCELPRSCWLSPEHARRLPTETAEALAAQTMSAQRPMFVACADAPAIRRGFVVPDGWWDDLSGEP